VKYKGKHKRFELACYKNKVQDWRAGIEKDLDEVLQIDEIFTNVSKGVLANKKDLEAQFGDMEKSDIVLLILSKGQLQVGAKEREAEFDAKFKEIAAIVADKCVSSETKRPFPIDMIESALKQAHFAVNPNSTAKKQALEAIALLKEQPDLHLERAQMRLRLEVPKNLGKQAKEKITPLAVAVEEEWGINYEMTILIDPGAYRSVNEVFLSLTKGQGQIEVLDMKGNLALDEEKF